MKPLRLEMEAFGPYVEKQVIDFESLAEKGLFLITGETGSGKTTIFDAMMLALYGNSSGSTNDTRTGGSGRNDLNEWRCNQADEKATTMVSLTFSVGERTYRFTRGLQVRRTAVTAFLEAGELDEDGVLVPFFEKITKEMMTKKAEELIGLTSEQFRRVVLLPQGQFEKFLTAKSDEKEGVLTAIFEAERWKRYADKLYEKTAARLQELKSEHDKMMTLLNDAGCETSEELEAKIAALKKEDKQAEAAHKAFAGEKKREKLNEDRGLAEAFKPLHELEKKRDRMVAQKPEIQKLLDASKRAVKANAVRGELDEKERAASEAKLRANDRAAKAAKLPALEQAAAKAKEALDKHLATSPVEELNRQIGEYQSKSESYRVIGERKAAYDKEKAAYIQEKNKADAATAAYEKALEKAREAKEEYDRAREKATDCRDRYFKGIYGTLAEELEQDKPCPVCGSTEHPHPAPKTQDSVDKATVEAAETSEKVNRERWDAAEKSRQQADEAQKNADKTLTEIKERGTAAKAALEEAQKNLIDGIADAAALDKAVKACKEKITQYETDTDKKKKALDDANAAMTQAKTALETAEGEAKKAQKALDTAAAALQKKLEENGYDSEEAARADMMDEASLRAASEKVTAYKTTGTEVKKSLEETQKKLAGKTEPDATQFDDREREINDEAKTYERQRGERAIRIKQLTDKQARVAELEKHYNAEIEEAERDAIFAKKLRGDSDVGLLRYVLAVMFSQVIGEANRMLQMVHGGRYQLFCTSDGKDRKKGLDLRVHDNRSPEKEGRPVDTLSGGEKFLASLALSIGLSTVAQNSGTPIKALFIDEGFGTLDTTSINDAMDVLNSVRQTDGMIGIISHVELLEDNIPTHLEVVKEDAGSYIRMG